MSAGGSYTRKGSPGGPKDQGTMHVCTTCGSTFKDCVDFCFYDGEVLVPADAVAVADRVTSSAPVATEHGASAQQQGAQPTYDPEEVPVLVGAYEASSDVGATELDGDIAVPVPSEAQTSGDDEPMVPSQVDTLTDINLDDVAQAASATPASSAPTLPPTPVPPEIAGHSPGDDDGEPYDAMPVASLHDPPASEDDTVPPVPGPSDNVGATANDAPTQPGASPRPASRSPRPPPRAITFEAQEDDPDRGRMIAIGAVALFLGLVFLVGAGAMAVTMGGNALLGDRGLADARPAVPPTPSVAPGPVATARPMPQAAPDAAVEGTDDTTDDTIADGVDAEGLDAVAMVESPDPLPTPAVTALPPTPTPGSAASIAAPVSADPRPAPTPPADVALAPTPRSPERDVPVPAKTSKLIEVTSDPIEAVLWWDGENMGPTPVSIDASFAKHTYRFELDGYGTKNGTLLVDDGTNSPFKGTLDAVSGEVDVMVFLKNASGGSLWVDGEPIGEMPASFAIDTARHTFEVRCNGAPVFQGQASATAPVLPVVRTKIFLSTEATNVTINRIGANEALCQPDQ